MVGPLTTFSLRSTLAAGALLALLGSAPARAVTSTVYWDRADYGSGAGFGLSAATATGSGITIFDIDRTALASNTLPTTDSVNQSFTLPTNGDPASASQDWSVTNNVIGLNDGLVGNENLTLYIVYQRPDESSLVVDGVTQPINYPPADVGLELTSGVSGRPDWVIFRTIASSGDTVYLPAVSLGTLAFNGSRDYSLFYSLQNPQVFQGEEELVTKLGVPAWDLLYIARPAVPIPEPASGLLLMFGLVAIARARRQRA